MLNPFSYFFDKSIKRAVLASFIFVLLLPMGFFGYSLFENTWEKAQQSMLEKHELIASAMVVPISLFITSRQHSLQNLGHELLSIEQEEGLLPRERDNKSLNRKVQIVLDKYQKSFGDLVAVTYVSKLGEKIISINENYQKTASSYIPNYQNIPLKELSPIDEKFKDKGADLFSPVFQSTISNNPVILLKHYILNKEGVIKCALFTEISTKYITDMCSKISFGDKGHCAIVDQTGHVVAHPNKNWVKEIRDLSKLSVIKKMLDGQVGTTEFHSPFLKADMVAGFSAIPNLGWGIMIPQPKIELTRSLGTIRKNTLIWLSLGILVALGVAYLLTQKITNPIKILMKRAHDASAGYDFIQLGSIPKNSPKEINQLWDSISLLLTSLQNSNREVKKLNVSLSRDINKATKNLRSMNKHLYDVSSKDYLTSLANRRFFNNYINKVIEKNKNIGLILIDIDDFKSINDLHGHEIGDLALKHISMILQKSTRKGDLVSRLGGDEFIVYVKNSSEKTIAAVAEKIRLITEVNPIKVKGITINLSLSIGTVIYKAGSEAPTLEELLRLADGAMYSSKQSGRNKVTSCKFYPTTELTA